MNQQPAEKAYKVLAVDDVPEDLEIIAKALGKSGLEVTTALSGEQALELAARERFALALVDMHMPGLSGAELARRLLAEHGCFSLILSADGRTDRVVEAVNDGALGYLLKPFDVSRMRPTILAAILRARELASLVRSHEHLRTALLEGRETSMAVGILIERFRLDRETAFNRLRDTARSQRRKVEDVAADLVGAAETVNLAAPPRPAPARS